MLFIAPIILKSANKYNDKNNIDIEKIDIKKILILF